MVDTTVFGENSNDTGSSLDRPRFYARDKEAAYNNACSKGAWHPVLTLTGHEWLSQENATAAMTIYGAFTGC